MTDLIDKFYLADLSPEEEEALDGLLASSPEAAGRFAEKAAQAYSRFGLPDPGPTSDRDSRRSWLWLLLFLALAMGYGWYRYGGELRKGSTPTSRTATTSSPETENRQTTGVPSNVPAKVFSQSLPGGNKLPGLVPDSNLSEVQGPRTTPATPLPQSAGHKIRSQLKITIQIQGDGPVTVQILNSKGLAVKNLYMGPLAAGTYAFAWDGRMNDGHKAPPGDYRVQTQTAANVQNQEFSILAKDKK